MSVPAIQMIVDIPVLATGSEADAEEIAVHLISTTGSGQEPVYTEIPRPSVHDTYLQLALNAEPDKLLLMMARLATLWARWDDADGRLLPAAP